MKTLPKSPIPDAREFSRFFGIPGVKIKIRRMGHPLSLDHELEAERRLREEEKRQRLEDARARVAAAEEREARDVTAKEVYDKDAAFRAFWADAAEAEARREATETERIAARHIAGWGGAAFKSSERPKDGAFTLEDVVAAIFEPHGTLGEGEPLPAFEDEETGAPVWDGERIARGVEIAEQERKRLDAAFEARRGAAQRAAEAVTDLEKRLEKWKEADGDVGALVESLQAARETADQDWRAAYEEDRERITEEAEAALKAAGLRRCAFAGLALREALAAQILHYAQEVATAWSRAAGFLDRSSRIRAGSGRSTRPRIKTSNPSTS